jgi:hypothetical protein
MTIYYQESRISSIAFAKTENDLNGLKNFSNKAEIFKIDPKFENSLQNEKSQDGNFTDAVQITLNDILNSISNLDSNIKTFVINAESPIFNDIVFSIDSNKVEINSESIHQDPLSGISLGNSVMLDSLMDQHFVILPGRQSSNIKICGQNVNQNHECIDAIAKNGLMNSPKIMSEYSVGKLIEAIAKNKKLKNLNIYIIHSALKVKLLNYSGISSINIPCYAVGRGEILSVFYRYLAITFFPYMAVYDSNESVDYKYDI